MHLIQSKVQMWETQLHREKELNCHNLRRKTVEEMYQESPTALERGRRMTPLLLGPASGTDDAKHFTRTISRVCSSSMTSAGLPFSFTEEETELSLTHTPVIQLVRDRAGVPTQAPSRPSHFDHYDLIWMQNKCVCV